MKHTWHALPRELCEDLERAETSRLGRITLIATLGTGEEMECAFLLNQRKVMVEKLGNFYLLRRRQPKIVVQPH